MPPSRYLGLSWPEWGETDFLLTQAQRLHDQMVCSCGCGQWRPVAYDPEREGDWHVDVDVCYPRAAIDQYLRQHEKDMPDGAMLRVRLLAEGEDVPESEFVYDPARAASEKAKMLARFGLTSPDA